MVGSRPNIRILAGIAAVIAAAVFILITNLMAAPREHTAGVVFLGDEDFLLSVLKDLNSADRDIKCALYMFRTDGNNEDSTHLILNSMLDALNRGVNVGIIFDIEEKGDLSTQYNEYTGRILERAGATVVYDSPERRLHAKMCVIDSSITYIGSHNYTFSALKRNAETTVRVSSDEMAADVLYYLANLGLE